MLSKSVADLEWLARKLLHLFGARPDLCVVRAGETPVHAKQGVAPYAPILGGDRDGVGVRLQMVRG